MKIVVTPGDLIERCVWDQYHRFVLRGKVRKKDIDELLKKNEEFEIDEKTAFVIGLLNRIHTPFLTYKLNQELKADLENKSTHIEKEDRYYINKYNLEDTAHLFLRKFPKEYESKSLVFRRELEKLPELIEIFIYNLNQLESIMYKGAPMVKIKQVKKIINEVFSEKNYYDGETNWKK